MVTRGCLYNNNNNSRIVTPYTLHSMGVLCWPWSGQVDRHSHGIPCMHTGPRHALMASQSGMAMAVWAMLCNMG